MQTKPRHQFHLHPWLSRPIFWFAIALVIRLLYLLEQGGTSPLFYQPTLDEREAFDSAMALINGTAATEPYFKAPGYTWIFAAVISISGNAWPWIIRIIQHAAGAWLVAMAVRLTAKLTQAGSPRKWAAIVTGFFAATYAPLIRLENNLSLDFWAVFFQSAMLCTLARAIPKKQIPWRPVLCAGCLAAAAWLVRPTITVTLPFIALWLAWAPAPRTIRHALTMPILLLLPVIMAASGIAIRNYAVSGEPLAMPWQGGYAFYHANREGANGRYYLQGHIVETSHANPTRQLAISGYKKNLTPIDRAAFENSPDYAAVDDFWFNTAIVSIKANPIHWLQLMGKKSLYLFSDKEIYNYEDFDLQRQRSTILSCLPGRFGIIFPIALASLATLGFITTPRRRIHSLLWLYILTLGSGIALYYVSGRMRMPIAFPMLALSGCAAGGFIHLSTRRKWLAGALLILGIIIAWTDWWGVRSESMAHVDLARMSNAAWRHGRYEQALDLVLEAEKIAPHYPVIPRLKGQALYNLGHLKEARHEFQQSVKILGDQTSKNNIETINQELNEK